jgi:hypothetical protein
MSLPNKNNRFKWQLFDSSVSGCMRPHQYILLPMSFMGFALDHHEENILKNITRACCNPLLYLHGAVHFI